MYEKSNEILKRFIKDNNLVYKNKRLTFPDNSSLNWKIVKKNPEFLTVFNPFRKQYVDTLLEEIMSDLHCKPACHPISVGSAKMDSDYDVTVYGPLTQKIIAQFNNIFKRKFRCSSKILFDTNIYGLSFLQETPPTSFSYIKKDPSICTPDNFVLLLDTKQNPIDQDLQRIWSYVKLYLHIHDLSSQEKKDIKHEISSILDDKQLKLYIEAKNKYKSMKTSSNYVKELTKYHSNKVALESSVYEQERVKLMIKLKDQISKTNYYGDETYFTQGAFNHVVGKGQSGYTELNIYPEEYKDSLIENIGECIKEYNLYKDKNIFYFYIHASKYILRCIDAISNLHDFPYKDISIILNKLLKNRSSNSVICKEEIKQLNFVLTGNEKTSSFESLLSILNFLEVVNNKTN